MSLTHAAPAMPWKTTKGGKAPTVNPMAAMIDEYAALKAQASPIEKRIKELKETLDALGEGDHKGNKCILAIAVSERTSLDGKALADALPDVAAQFQRTSTVTTLRIKALV